MRSPRALTWIWGFPGHTQPLRMILGASQKADAICIWQAFATWMGKAGQEPAEEQQSCFDSKPSLTPRNLFPLHWYLPLCFLCPTDTWADIRLLCHPWWLYTELIAELSLRGGRSLDKACLRASPVAGGTTLPFPCFSSSCAHQKNKIKKKHLDSEVSLQRGPPVIEAEAAYKAFCSVFLPFGTSGFN